ncbi:MAG: hypothetical protein IKN85_09550 [Oscillospiraceae bacterium]|nr:hypothetical protein [Oscillospiraceae bacterium]
MLLFMVCFSQHKRKQHHWTVFLCSLYFTNTLLMSLKRITNDIF